jgi:hypothetical protein
MEAASKVGVQAGRCISGVRLLTVAAGKEWEELWDLLTDRLGGVWRRR